MKKLVISSLLVSSLAISGSALAIIPPPDNQDSGKKTSEYLKHLGSYLGFNLAQDGQENLEAWSLISPKLTQVVQTSIYGTFIGARPVNSILPAILPESVEIAGVVNSLANTTFLNYNSPSESKVSVSPLIDQETYQKDPTNQAILNVLTTPDFSFCMNNDMTQFNEDCDLLYQVKVMENAIGPLPDTNTFFAESYNQPVVPQLNANSLLGPMMYNMQSSGGGANNRGPLGTGSPVRSKDSGLKAENQGQMAQNFIRYVTSQVSPLSLASRSQYDTLYQQTLNKQDPKKQAIAKARLSRYLTQVRTYSSQFATAVSNLYFLLSKRMPNQQLGGKTSQALDEFNMATWRLFDPKTNDANKQWTNKINKASSTTTLKEMAVLLSEINYQLYLNRQMQERLLLTNNILLLQNLNTARSMMNLESENAKSNPLAGF